MILIPNVEMKANLQKVAASLLPKFNDPQDVVRQELETVFGVLSKQMKSKSMLMSLLQALGSSQRNSHFRGTILRVICMVVLQEFGNPTRNGLKDVIKNEEGLLLKLLTPIA